MSYTRTATVASVSSWPSRSRPNASRFWPTISSDVVISGVSVATAAAGRSPPPAGPPPSRTMHPATAMAASRLLREPSVLDDDLAIHPRVRRADVVVDARLREGDAAGRARDEHAGVPVALL